MSLKAFHIFFVTVCVLLMLVVAAILEGFARQLINETAGRFAVGGFMLLFWLTYFFAFRRDANGAGER